MGEYFSGRDPVTYLMCLRSFLVCVLVEETSTYFPSITLSPHYVIRFVDVVDLFSSKIVLG